MIAKLNNEVAGFKFSVIGILYAVLLAFVVVLVWCQAAIGAWLRHPEGDA